MGDLIVVDEPRSQVVSGRRGSLRWRCCCTASAWYKPSAGRSSTAVGVLRRHVLGVASRTAGRLYESAGIIEKIFVRISFANLKHVVTLWNCLEHTNVDASSYGNDIQVGRSVVHVVQHCCHDQHPRNVCLLCQISSCRQWCCCCHLP